jgi:hypothetical protein
VNCRKCERVVNEDFNFCPYCQEPVQQRDSGYNTINAGNNNINIGLGNNSKQEFYIDNFNVAPNISNELVVEYENCLDRKVVGGIRGYKLKFEISGVLSVISAVITIFTYFVKKSDFSFFLLMVSLGCGVYALESINKHKKLKNNGVYKGNSQLVLYKDDNGDVYTIRKYGVCPICGGRVNIYNDERFKKKLGRCVNNRDHIYSYDHTINKGFPLEIVEFVSNK